MSRLAAMRPYSSLLFIGIAAGLVAFLLERRFPAAAAGLSLAMSAAGAAAIHALRRQSAQRRALSLAVADLGTRPSPSDYDRGWRPLVGAIQQRDARFLDLAGSAATTASQTLAVSHGMVERASQVSTHAQHQEQEATSLAAAMEEMDATSQEIAKNATTTADNATRITQANEQSLAAVESVVAAIGNISELFDSTADALRELHQSSAEVEKIVGIITGIAGETNLLAFNAAIEAARAGDAGRGFAVVADEVKKLSTHTAQHARDITDVVTQTTQRTASADAAIAAGRSAVARSVARAETALSAMRHLTQHVGEIQGMTHQIAAATEQQSSTASQMAHNVERIAHLSGETHERIAAARSEAEQLIAAARSLDDGLRGFDLCCFGLVPADDPFALVRSWAPLCQVVGQILGRRIVPRVGESYEGAVQDLGSGRAIMSYLTPSTYVEARQHYGAEPLVVPLSKGQSTYRSAVVVRADSSIQMLADLRGKRFAFGDPLSTASKAMPEYLLRESGVSLGDLESYGFAGSHDAVARAVERNEFDAGGLMLSVAERYGKSLKIIATSEPIPQFPVCASSTMAASDRDALIKGLVDLTDPDILKTLGAHITGFARIQDRDYDGVRAMLAKLGR
ncbi:MAG: phosphate/phosphite/phosphonate ABC transporter substrate-binding protein [Acidiferrobacterales bacterium]